MHPSAGSPFLVNIGGNPSGRVRETVTKEMETAEAVSPGTTAEFILQIPGKRLANKARYVLATIVRE